MYGSRINLSYAYLLSLRSSRRCMERLLCHTTLLSASCKPVSILNSNWLRWKQRALGACWKTHLARSSVPSADMHNMYKHYSGHWQNTATAERGGNTQLGEGKPRCASPWDPRILFSPSYGLCDLGQDFPILELSIFKSGYDVKNVEGSEMVT